MLIEYKTLSKYVNVEMDSMDNLEAHLPSIVRSMNIDGTGNLIYNETIDPELIVLTGETQYEQDFIDRISGAQPYILDATSGQYLSNQLERYTFSLNGTGHKEKYMDLVPGIASNVLPFKVFAGDSFVIKWIQFENTYLASGAIIDIRNTADESVLWQLDVGTTPLYSYYAENIDITVSGPVNYGLYINNNRLDNPAIIMGVRQIFTV